jgi:hypothetical protein
VLKRVGREGEEERGRAEGRSIIFCLSKGLRVQPTSKKKTFESYGSKKIVGGS